MSFKLNPEQTAMLAKNALTFATDQEADLLPVAKLFQMSGPAKWLLIWLDPADPSFAFGIADLGLGFVEEGLIDLADLAKSRSQIGADVELDRFWSPSARCSTYLADGQAHGRLNCKLIDPVVLAELQQVRAAREAAFGMTPGGKAAYEELTALGAPVYDRHGETGTQFKIGGELRDSQDTYYANFYRETIKTENGLREDVSEILKRHGLIACWLNASSCGIYDPTIN